MFEGLFQPAHLVLVLVIVLIVFGPGKLPEIGGALGKSIREFKRATTDGFVSETSAPAVDPPTPTPPSRPVCAACHAENPIGNRFCGSCGARLT